MEQRLRYGEYSDFDICARDENAFRCVGLGCTTYASCLCTPLSLFFASTAQKDELLDHGVNSQNSMCDIALAVALKAYVV